MRHTNYWAMMASDVSSNASGNHILCSKHSLAPSCGTLAQTANVFSTVGHCPAVRLVLMVCASIAHQQDVVQHDEGTNMALATLPRLSMGFEIAASRRGQYHDSKAVYSVTQSVSHDFF